MFIEKVISDNQVEIIETLAYEIWNEHFTPIIGQAQVDYMLEKFQSKKSIADQIKQGYLYFLFKNNNHYIGYTSVLPEKNRLFLSKLYIVSSQRNSGHGRKALIFLEQLALGLGLNKITLTVNKNNINSIKAYEKLGFKNLKSVVQDIGHNFVMDDYQLEKTINMPDRNRTI